MGRTGALTVGAQLDTWMGALRLEESTRAGYASAVRFWKAAVCDTKTGLALGDKALRALRTSDVQTALATRTALSGKTVNNYVTVLREAIELAVTDRILAENPVTKVPRARHQTEPPDPFSRDELERVCAEVSARYPGQVANLVETWFWTGMRTSEIFGLQWKNVDLASKSLVITEALVRGRRKDITETHSSRLVKLNSRALAAIKQQRQHTQMAGGAVFHDPRYGAPWEDERAFRRSFWTPTLKLLGIRYRPPYNMRHTHATIMLMADVSPTFAAKQLGHSVGMFLQHYKRWVNCEPNDLEIARLNSALAAAVPSATE
ncbi:MAG: tyrosine-type recombinase/integrase [Massilia sp.]